MKISEDAIQDIFLNLSKEINLKTIAYICSYEINDNIATEELSKQSAEIKNFCKLHDLELNEISEETSTRDDFKPVLLNMMSNQFSPSDKLIVANPNVISRNKDFRDWIVDEFTRMKVEIIYLTQDTEEKTLQFERNITTIKERIKNIPSLPEIITKSIEIMQDENASVGDLSKVISNDIGLTARVLKLVNSAYYGFPKQISTIQQSISILGFTTIKGVILSASIYKMFSNKNNQTFNYKDFWKHSLLVASSSRMLSKYVESNFKEDIFAAAFLHDIGKIILAQYDWQNYSQVCSQKNLSDLEMMKVEEQYCGLNHCEIANIVAYSWNLPEIFCDIITYHHYPLNSFKFKKECSIVYLSNLIVDSIMRNENLNYDNIPLDLLENLEVSVDNICNVHDELRELSLSVNDIDSFFE